MENIARKSGLTSEVDVSLRRLNKKLQDLLKQLENPDEQHGEKNTDNEDATKGKITLNEDDLKRINCSIAECFMKKAEKMKEIHKLRSLKHWLSALKHYAQSFDVDFDNYLNIDRMVSAVKSKSNGSDDISKSILGYARCLLEISKYNKVLDLLKNSASVCKIETTLEYWCILTIAHKKLFQYEQAELCFKNVDENKYSPISEFSDTLLNQVKRKIDKDKKPGKDYFKTKRSEYQNYNATHKDESGNPENNNNLRRPENRKSYRILSVDGGGIRGIIPAIWLCEIEKRTRKPISNLFDMVSGTSTGGIIAAALSLPKQNTNNKNESSVNAETPEYNADYIYDIYIKEGKNIFGKNDRYSFIPETVYSIYDKLSNIFWSQYTDARYNVFQKYFKECKMSTSLIDIVIPACSENNLLNTYVFNAYDARTDLSKNDKYVDVLMATSAAPTYFPSYKIEGKGVFNDGGIHVNNPALIACNEALRYGTKNEDISVLSLGTGSYYPIYNYQNNSRGSIFWAKNLYKIALEAQAGNTDIGMSNAFGEKYQRWQILFDEEAKMDDFSDTYLNFLEDHAYQFIEDNDDIFQKVANHLETGYLI